VLRFLLPLLITGLAVSARAETKTVGELLVRSVPSPSRASVEIDSIERVRIECCLTAEVGDGWQPLEADSEGWFVADALRGSYARATVTVPEESTWILEGMGYGGVLVNGDPRIGNLYGYTDDWEPWQPPFDFSFVPVRLRAGANEFLFFGNRYGKLRAKLHRAESALSLNAADVTLPDLVVGEPVDSPGAIVILNATGEPVRNAVLRIELEGVPPRLEDVPLLPPFGLRKVGFSIRGESSPRPGPRALGLRLEQTGMILDETVLELKVKTAGENRRVTFVSQLDGSVQYYGLLPASEPGAQKALVLSLHGAAVEAINQSGSYAPMTWAHVVAPTNRRPFGFSWEDWGRLDGLEVLDLARADLRIAPDRIYLTGHSMGGHGSWHLATLHPDRFAAVGPSAGWISLWSYRMDPPADPPSDLVALVERATLQSRTLELAPNLDGLGVYVLHGDADDNVPVEQAQLMLARLEEFHRDYVVHLEAGAGHWWDRSADEGADCVAWPPMFDFFARHRRPADAERRENRFLTPSPGTSAWHAWAGILGQQRAFGLSGFELDRDPTGQEVRGTTRNVSDLAIDFSSVDAESVSVELDGESMRFARPEEGPLWLRRGEDWQEVSAPDPSRKGPHRYGGFREVFARNVQFVYATGGTPEENAWALAKARYDAEMLWYRGNSSIDVIADTAFDPDADPDRNVVLYGNAESHLDWQALWHAPCEVRRNAVKIGRRSWKGGGLGVLAVHPRPGSDLAMVGIVAATGAAGARLLQRRPVFDPGVAYPDLTLFSSEDAGPVVVGAGYFGPDWSLGSGEFEWTDPGR
jgi:dienelactone hydrolase